MHMVFRHFAGAHAVFGIPRLTDYRIIGMSVIFLNINVAISVVSIKAEAAFTDSIQSLFWPVDVRVNARKVSCYSLIF